MNIKNFKTIKLTVPIHSDSKFLEALEKAFRSRSYLITVSFIDDLDKTKINHFVATYNFPRKDITSSMDECFKLLEKEI